MPRSLSSISSLRTGRAGAAAGIGLMPLEGSVMVLPLMWVDYEAGQRLRVEIGRLLGQDVTLPGNLDDGGDRRRSEREGDVGAVRRAVPPGNRLLRRLGVDNPAGSHARLVDPGELLEDHLQERDIKMAQGLPPRRP